MLSNTTWLSPVANWPQLATSFRPHSCCLAFLRQADNMGRPPLPCRSDSATFRNIILLFTVVFNGASFITGVSQRRKLTSRGPDHYPTRSGSLSG